MFHDAKPDDSDLIVSIFAFACERMPKEKKGAPKGLSPNSSSLQPQALKWNSMS
jgi:hypothetical protein